MVVFLNGDFVPEERAVVPVTDRAFLYGDGLFETLPIYGGTPFRCAAHVARLSRGLELLRIKLPFSPTELEPFVRQLAELNKMRDAVVRITVSRGSGLRGYSIKSAQTPVVIMTLHPLPAEPSEGWRLIISSFRVLADDPLAQSKTCSRVRSVLARAEAEDRGANEALLLNERGEITEGAATNVFWIQERVVCTTPLSTGILPGVTRATVLELCEQLKLPASERAITPKEFGEVDGVLVTLSTIGVVEAISVDGFKLPRSPAVSDLRAAYRALVRAETGANL
jgi:aminodeoxychorismate lyase